MNWLCEVIIYVIYFQFHMNDQRWRLSWYSNLCRRTVGRCKCASNGPSLFLCRRYISSERQTVGRYGSVGRCNSISTPFRACLAGLRLLQKRLQLLWWSWSHFAKCLAKQLHPVSYEWIGVVKCPICPQLLELLNFIVCTSLNLKSCENKINKQKY